MATIEKAILAIITTDKTRAGGGSPIFYAKDPQQMEEIGLTMEVILDAMVHEIDEDLMIVVKHA